MSHSSSKSLLCLSPSLLMYVDHNFTWRENWHFALNSETCFVDINYCSFASAEYCGLCNVCMVVLVKPPICRCQVPGSTRWKKTTYMQTFSVLTPWDGKGLAKSLGCVWTLGSVQYVGIMAGLLLTTVRQPPACMCFLLLLLKNASRPKETPQKRCLDIVL